MATKRDYQKWGRNLSIIGGILFVAGGILLILALIINSFSLDPILADLVAKGLILNLIGIDWIIAVIQIVIGVVCIALPTSNLSDLLMGIVLLVLGIIGIGIPGLIVVIGAILYFIAASKKR